MAFQQTKLQHWKLDPGQLFTEVGKLPMFMGPGFSSPALYVFYKLSTYLFVGFVFTFWCHSNSIWAFSYHERSGPKKNLNVKISMHAPCWKRPSETEKHELAIDHSRLQIYVHILLWPVKVATGLHEWVTWKFLSKSTKYFCAEPVCNRRSY